MRFYRGDNDTHLYSRDLANVVRNRSSLLHKHKFVPAEIFQKILADIRKYYGPHLSGESLVGLLNIQQRYQASQGGFFDPDLDGANGAGLLWFTWSLVRRANDSSVYRGFLSYGMGIYQSLGPG